MPAFIAWILGGLATVLQSAIPRVLFALGIGFVTFAGFQVALDSIARNHTPNASRATRTTSGTSASANVNRTQSGRTRSSDRRSNSGEGTLAP